MNFDIIVFYTFIWEFARKLKVEFAKDDFYDGF